jgi:hypothetical protein
MALTVQSVANDAYTDLRQVIGISTPDLTKFTPWVDRIHKDCLHSSVYSYLNVATTQFNTVAGQTGYALTPTNIRRILGVYDFTRQRILFPVERATTPVSQVEKQETNPGQQGAPPQTFGMPAQSPISLQVAQPGYFRHIGAQQLNLYPTPQAPLQINVSYEQQVATLVNPTDVLLMPEDARDMVVAGVNYLQCTYLKRLEEAQIWASIYSALKKGESLV